MNLDAKYPEIEARLTGCDGNIFMLIAVASRALRRAGVDQSIVSEFAEDVMNSKSYDAALQVIMKWVNVT